MKKLIIIIIIVLVVGLIGFSIARERNVSKANFYLRLSALKSKQPANLQQANLEIRGMTCVSCATGIEYALKQKNGVVSAKVSYQSKTGVVIYKPAEISKDEIIQAIKPYTAVITEDKLLK